MSSALVNCTVEALRPRSIKVSYKSIWVLGNLCWEKYPRLYSWSPETVCLARPGYHMQLRNDIRNPDLHTCWKWLKVLNTSAWQCKQPAVSKEVVINRSAVIYTLIPVSYKDVLATKSIFKNEVLWWQWRSSDSCIRRIFSHSMAKDILSPKLVLWKLQWTIRFVFMAVYLVCSLVVREWPVGRLGLLFNQAWV